MRGYLGSLAFFKVLGRWKVTDVRTFNTFFLLVFFKDLAALVAFALASVLAAAERETENDQ